MAIGLTEEHEALAASVRGFAERNITSQVVREGGEGVLAGLAAQGLPGLHLPEDAGGQGFGILEQAVALEELGRALVPGPYTPTVLASAVLHASGASKLPAGLADGSRTAAVGLSGSLELDGSTVSGTVEPVLGAPLADVFVLPAGERWVVLERDEVTVGSLESLDVTRPVGSVTVDGVAVPDERILDADVRALAVVLLGAEACGVAGRALDDAVAYAKLREQFGRPIGQFQAVKHKCARMLIDVERARAAVWDAARALDEPEEQRAYALGVAAALAADAAVTCAEGNIQVHGGIGYTYEHDAHLIYRRALTLRALLGRASAHRAEVAALAVAGVRRPMSIDLPEEAEPLREEIRARVAELAAMEPLEQRAAMAEGGWVTPHLPKPWGRDAGPMEQIVIQQELKAAKVRPVPLMIAAWVVPSLVQYGTREQQERFLPPTLRGEIIWCQLFSEPGAGSDLAGLRTRAERVEGGWKITGQKIWTSLARDAQWGICIARTDPDRPKHDGITYFLVDMTSPGIDVRPLRECTGDAVFNEVFLDGVFVPDDLVVGPVNAGWRVARTTLANERVGLTSTFQLGGDLPKLLELAAALGLADDPVVRDGIGRLACDEHSFNLLGLRATLKQLSGTDPGATANVRKLVAMEHGQQVTEFGFTLLGEEGALTGGRKDELRRRWTRYLLASRAMSIGGGTTEVNLNVIGERILGLPRDPEPGR
ncbi:alkylation response protein AidB-like acyl-CoA dehydrogenase [Actinomadura hallensis]|uniref:Alkylation response protein AidB-like acyl-CoA dehydrogenase n=1 Tax=Actinomadura hallensis TaxID=337895 RepID=A0A543IA42_9ACTN|nr:acyl-CoA dehydrogenase [Actinomadura hallensis]TQM67446.1 alkylation response protein AidB-like acyl-CoA dehydrogenase [Actinomadura hallensis]HLV72386.1 acyl-CoA dehydrogenase [Vulgatibacteraceae bacterium]